MRDIPKDIARVKGRTGREARFLKPYLFDALDRVPATHPLGAAAKSVLKNWDGSMFADAVNSTTLDAGEVIFSAWLDETVKAIFGHALGDLLTVAGAQKDRVAEGTSNMLLHLLDEALGEGSDVAPNLDYLAGRDPNALMSQAFDRALTGLAARGPDPASWTAPRGYIDFNHPIISRIIGRPVAQVPFSNRATYAQIIQLLPSGIRGESIFTLGQSGFIHLVPTTGGFRFDAHFFDQKPLYERFEYKPMPLYLNTELRE